MKYLYLSLLIIFLTVCLAFATEFEDEHGYEIDDQHDESIHDVEEDSGDDPYTDAATDFFSSLTKDDMKNHFKDIIRGFSDKGFEDCDKDKDNFIDVSEIECFVSEKMGYEIKTVPENVVRHYDKNQDNKLDADEVWDIVENKDPEMFKILPSTVAKNMLLMHGVQEEHIQNDDPAAGIFY